MNNNKKIGNDFESKFCEILYGEGFWVHNLAQNSAGQPADVLAVRNGKAYLIDCKVCSTNGNFSLSRIEENQSLSMQLWEECGNEEGWFAILLPEGQIYMVSNFWMAHYRRNQSSIREEKIRTVGIPLTKWVKSRL